MIPAQQIIEILQVHVDNPTWSQNRISRKLKISKFTVQTVFRNNFYHKRSFFTDDKKDFVLDNLHIPVKQLAIQLGVSHGTIYKFLQKCRADRKTRSKIINY